MSATSDQSTEQLSRPLGVTKSHHSRVSSSNQHLPALSLPTEAAELEATTNQLDNSRFQSDTATQTNWRTSTRKSRQRYKNTIQNSSAG
jgi:hypothetical protein